MLSAKRNKKAAKRFLKKALGSKHNQIPRAITVDKVPLQKILKLKQNFSFTSKNIKKAEYFSDTIQI